MRTCMNMWLCMCVVQKIYCFNVLAPKNSIIRTTFWICHTHTHIHIELGKVHLANVSGLPESTFKQNGSKIEIPALYPGRQNALPWPNIHKHMLIFMLVFFFPVPFRQLEDEYALVHATSITKFLSSFLKIPLSMPFLLNCHLWHLLFATDTVSAISSWVCIWMARASNEGWVNWVTHLAKRFYTSLYYCCCYAILPIICTLLRHTLNKHLKMIDLFERLYSLGFYNSTTIDHLNWKKTE